MILTFQVELRLELLQWLLVRWLLIKWVAVLETSLLVGIIQLLADEIKAGLTVSEIVLVVEPELV